MKTKKTNAIFCMKSSDKKTMDDLKRSIFTKVESVNAARILARDTNCLLKSTLAVDFLWVRSGFKSVHPCPVEPRTHRIVLLKSELPAELVKMAGATSTSYNVTVSYQDCSADEVLRVLIPECSDPPTSFETVGHIAHMNLREEFMPVKNLIGDVILDKNAHIDVVVTKVGELSGDFRTFAMEVIASRVAPNLVALVSENKMKLTVDYEKCYWNSRLSTERSRLLKSFLASAPPGNIRFLDMCCGIGALSCFCAREGMEVFANDLNPSAVACVKQNIISNRLEGLPITVSNLDGRLFIRNLFEKVQSSSNVTNFVMINLPEIGIEFLDVFVGLGTCESFKIYCHCFSREKPPNSDIRRRINRALSLSEEDLDTIKLSVVHVRDVAPNKIMYSAEFWLPKSVLETTKKPRLV